VTQSTTDRLGIAEHTTYLPCRKRARSGDTRSAKHAFLKHTSKKKQE